MPKRSELNGEIKTPPDFDFRLWCDRWDRMQEYYLEKRDERFKVMQRIIRAAATEVALILDIGCGTGTLTRHMIDAFPNAKVIGVDYDPLMLLLAVGRLGKNNPRGELIRADMRTASWTEILGGQRNFDAVVSSTALHWLLPEQLASLYTQVARLLKPGGIFLNADHVGNDNERIQDMWKRERKAALDRQRDDSADDWYTFWEALADAWGSDIDGLHDQIAGWGEGGVEDGMPLLWHFDKLSAGGFVSVDCFWRCNCDAIYGGLTEN